MQLIVLGMHRSGTSVTARLLNMMGAYFSHEGIEMPNHRDNPKGYWERLDVMELNDRLLGGSKAEWNKVSRFDPQKISPERQNEFRAKAAPIVQRLDAHRPWMMKDPRMCLTFSLWRPLLEIPICIFNYRSPLQVAHSLKKRDGIPLPVGIALWERHVVAALHAAKGLPKVLVLHDEMMKEPVETVEGLYHELVQQGVQGLRIPREKEIRAFLDAGLFHHRTAVEREPGFLNTAQIRLCEIFRRKQCEKMDGDFECSPGATAVLRQYELELLLQNRLIRRRQRREAGARLRVEALTGQNEALAEQNEALAKQNEAFTEQNRQLQQNYCDAMDELTDLRKSAAGRLFQPLRLLEVALKSLWGRPHKYLRKEAAIFYYSMPFFTRKPKKGN